MTSNLDVNISERVGRSVPRRRFKWEIHLPLIVICFLLSLPMLYALLVATHTLQDSFAPVSQLISPGSDLDNNIQELFTNENFDRVIWNTLVVTMVVVIAKNRLCDAGRLGICILPISGEVGVVLYGVADPIDAHRDHFVALVPSGGIAQMGGE